MLNFGVTRNEYISQLVKEGKSDEEILKLLEEQQEDFQQGTTTTDAVDVPQTQIASANVEENQDTELNLEATSSESQDLSYYKKNRSGKN